MSKSRDLSHTLFRRLRSRIDPRIKDGVARRLTQRVALSVLRSGWSSWDPIHQSAVKLATRAESIPVETLHALFEEVVGVLLTGDVVHIQEVHKAIDEATDWYLAMCICRKAKRVDDLYIPGTEEVRFVGSPDLCRPYFDRMLDTWEAIEDRVSDPEPAQILDDFAERRRQSDPTGTPAAFFEATWPHNEILLDHPNYTDAWRKSMRSNRRAWRVDKDFLHGWVDLSFYTRGVVFTSMLLVDQKYTICTCPGPEADGGCLLFNWHSFSGNPNIITEFAEGQRRDEKGKLLPCARFADRASDICYGCGCDHADPDATGPDGLEDPRPKYLPVGRG
ncbi:MAG: hypothetical protein HN348_19690 [Proteobacteria bacterium]|nr:hypothetical protein [Pseudomonadota bacterium]